MTDRGQEHPADATSGDDETQVLSDVDAGDLTTLIPHSPDAGEIGRLLLGLRRFDPARHKGMDMLGRGGMGAVHVVIDETLHRRVAMKILDPRLRENHRAVAWFLREVQITSQLDHPNIVPVHDVGLTADGRVSFTMKLVAGRTLAEHVASLGKPPLTDSAKFDLVDFIGRVCDALVFAHARGVIHCDLKPENVMVGRHGEVYLMDWGLARPCETRALRDEGGTRVIVTGAQGLPAGSIIGTPAYMAPELASGRDLDERTDVFSVGAILYHAFSGRQPYEGRSVAEILAKARRREMAPLSEITPVGSVPGGIDRIVEKATALDPRDRYQTMSDLRKVLTSLVRSGWEFQRRRVRAGERVIAEGEAGHEAFVIVDGRFEVRKQVDGKPVCLRVMEAGEVFGEMAILTKSPRSADVVAIEDSTVVVIHRDSLDREMSGISPWMAVMVRTLAERMKAIEEKTLGKRS